VRGFLIKVLLLTLPPIALVSAVAPPRALDSMRAISPLRYQVYRAAALGNSIRAIAVGDSHAALGFQSADAFVYSLAFPGENLAEIVLKARRVVKILPRLRAVFLQAQPHMFFQHRAGAAREEYAMLFGESNAAIRPTPFQLMLDPCCRGEIPGVAVKMFLGIPVGLPIPEIGPTGFSKYPPTFRYRGDLASDARREVASYVQTLANPELRRRFADLVAELRRQDIEVILTRYPLSPAYRAALGKQAFDDAEGFFRGLEAERGTSACGSWEAFSDPVMFFNSDHLSHEGALYYWRRVLSPCVAHIEAHRD
jgi:hypothetical protein